MCANFAHFSENTSNNLASDMIIDTWDGAPEDFLE